MILLVPLKIIDQNNEKNTIFLHFWIQVYPDAQKITHQKVNFWKNSIVVNKFGSNFHVICQSLRDTVDQSSDFFYGSNFSEVIWHSAQITKLFWIQNNVLSSMYTWKKKKVQCDIFPKWLYPSKKSQNCKNVDLKKIPCIFTWKYLLMLKMSHEKKW